MRMKPNQLLKKADNCKKNWRSSQWKSKNAADRQPQADTKQTLMQCNHGNTYGLETQALTSQPRCLTASED